MLEGLFMLLSLSTVMAIASFLAGTLPLSFTLSQAQLRLISTLGMGVLVGTALIVIIPEGVETLYSASQTEQSAHSKKGLYSREPAIQWAHDNVQRIRLRDAEDTSAFNLPGPVIPNTIGEDASLEGADGQGFGASRGAADPPKTPTEPGVVGILSEGVGNSNSEVDEQVEQGDASSHDHEDEGASPHAWVGMAIISGFILMYLIDTLPQLSPPSISTPGRSNIYSLSDLSSAGGRATNGASSPGPSGKASGSFSTTLGLLIHAFADGIALGASSSMPGLSFVVFFAIMVHKAPAAFGLTTVLLRQGVSKRQARIHLIAFSLAAPAGAIVTWLVAGLVGGLSGYTSGESGMKWWTGLILLFSGGTFLYVAMHTMQENDAAADEDEDASTSNSNGYLGLDSRAEHQHQHRSKKSLKLVGAAVAGMLLPAVTQIWHAH